jgi:hypothetical protein
MTATLCRLIAEAYRAAGEPPIPEDEAENVPVRKPGSPPPGPAAGELVYEPDEAPGAPPPEPPPRGKGRSRR